MDPCGQLGAHFAEPVLRGRPAREVTMPSGHHLSRAWTASVIAVPLLAAATHIAAPAAAELPTDQVRTVVFEMFTPPETSSGGG
jgi:hypothetical protein